MSLSLGTASADQRDFSEEMSSKEMLLLNETQNGRLFTLLDKTVFIRSKDNTSIFTPSVALIVDLFVHSYMRLSFGMRSDIAKKFRSSHDLATDHFVSYICSIRGSTTSSLLQNGGLNDDVDMVVKFSSPPPMLKDLSYFRTFCLMLGLDVFEQLESGMSSVCYHQSDFMTCSPHSTRLIDRINGVFKGFFPFPDQSKCIFSFNGLFDPKGEKNGVNLDITLVFRPEQTLKVFRPISPASSHSSSSSLTESFSAKETSWHASGSQSFAHDAVEIVLPSLAGRIDLRGQAFFRSLFGLDMPYILATLKSRSLVILDKNMHLGYRRIFYEITKGKIPFMEDEIDEQEARKISSMVCLMEENPISKIKPGLEHFLQIAKDKAEDKEFVVNLFLNGYMTIRLLLEGYQRKSNPSREDHRQMGKLTSLLHTFEREFIHDTWQELLPELAQKISPIENPIHVMEQIQQIKAHLSPFPESQVRLSLGQYVRVAGIFDKMHGFILSRSLKFEEICFHLKELKEILPVEIYQSFIDQLLLPIEDIHADPQAKWMFLFVLRRMEQSTLSSHEIGALSALLEPFFKTCIENPQVLEMLPLSNLILTFFDQSAHHLFQENLQLRFTKDIFQFCREKKDTSPLLLPTLFNYLLCVTRQKPVETSFLEQMTKQGKWGCILLETILSAIDWEESSIHDVKKLLPLLSPLSQFANQRLVKKVQAIIKHVLKTDTSHDLWEEEEKLALDKLFKGLLDRGQELFLIEMIFKASDLVSIDPLQIVLKKPALLQNLAEPIRSIFFIKALELSDVAAVETIVLSAEHMLPHLLKSYLSSPATISSSHIELLLCSESILSFLKADAHWFDMLAKQNEELSCQTFRRLSLSITEKECFEFTKTFKTLWKKSLTPFLLELESHSLRYIMQHQPHWLFEGKDDVIQQLSERQLITLARHILEIDYPFDKNTAFASFYLSLIKRLVESKIVEESLFYPLIERYIGSISSWHKQKGAKADAPYAAFLDQIISVIPKDKMSLAMSSTLKESMCLFDADHVPTHEYIRWATQQPKSEAIIININHRISKKDLGDEEFQLLMKYFTGHYKHLRNLIMMGEMQVDHRLPIEEAMIVLLKENKPLREELILIEHILQKNYPLSLLEMAVLKITQKELLTKPLREMVTALFERLKVNNPSLCRELLSRLSTPSAVGRDEENFKLLYTLAVPLAKQSSDEKSLTMLRNLIKINGEIERFFSSYIFKSKSHLAEYFSILIEASIDPSYTDLLTFAIDSCATCNPSYPDNIFSFSLIEREIVKINPLGKKNQSNLTKEQLEIVRPALCKFLITYLDLITREHSGFLFITWIVFQKEEIYKLLPAMVKNISSLPPKFLLDFFTFIDENKLRPRTAEEYSLIKKCLNFLLDLPDLNTCFVSFISYRSLCEEDTQWPSYLDALLDKALKRQEESMLQWIAEQIPEHTSSKEWKKRKTAMAEKITRSFASNEIKNIIEILSIITSFQNKVPIDIRSLFINIIINQTKKPFSEVSFQNIKMMIVATFSKQLFGSITQEDKKLIERNIDMHLSQMPFSSFREHYREISLTDFSPYFQLALKNLLKKYSLEFLTLICAKDVSEELYLDIALFSLYLLPMQGMSRENEKIVHFLLSTSIEKLIKSPNDSIIYHQCITALLGIYCCICVKDTDSEISPQIFHLSQKTLPLIHSRRFAIRYDLLYLLSYLRILHVVADENLLRSFIDQLHHHVKLSPPAETDKPTVFSLLTKTLIPLSQKMLRETSTTDIFCDIFLASWHSQALTRAEFHILCSLLDSLAHQPAPMDAEYSQRYIKHIEGLIKIFICYSDKNFSSESYRKFFSAILALSENLEVSKNLILDIHLSCKIALISLKNHPTIFEGLSELRVLAKGNRFHIDKTKIFEPLDIYLNLIPLISLNLESILTTNSMSKSPNHVSLSDAAYKEISDFLFLIDEHFDDPFYLNTNHQDLFSNVVTQASIKPFIRLFERFAKDADEENNPKVLIKYCRLFMGLIFFTSERASEPPLSRQEASSARSEFLFKEKGKASRALANKLSQITLSSLSLSTAMQQEILKLSLLRCTLCPEDNIENACFVAESLFKGEIRKKEKDISMMLQILTNLHSIYKASLPDRPSTNMLRKVAMNLWTSQNGIQIPPRIKTQLEKEASQSLLTFLSKDTPMQTPIAAVKMEDEPLALPSSTQEEEKEPDDRGQLPTATSFIQSFFSSLFQ